MQSRDKWPGFNLSVAPQAGAGTNVGHRVRAALGAGDGRISMRDCCSSAGVVFRRASLLPDQGGCEALLVPLRSGYFRIVVDPTPRTGWGEVPSGIRAVVARHRTRFRVAHELAHTFFYDRSYGRPVRLLPRGSKAEEIFADEFARALLAPAPPHPFSAADVVALQARWDVSLEVAARACAAAAKPRGVAIWRWRPDGSAFEPIMTQWSTGRSVEIALGLRQACATRTELLHALSLSAPMPGLSTILLDERCQALAVLA